MARIILSKNCCDCEGLTDPCAPCDVVQCCMYPADELNKSYGSGDLPDSVEVFDQFNTYTFTKNGSIYEFSNLSLRAIEGRWATFLDGDEIGDRSQPCLIAPNDTLRVTDFFADSYTLNAAEEVGLERKSLCVWSGIGGSDCSYELVYHDRGGGYWGGNPSPYKWTVQNIGIPFCGEGRIVTKLGSQNTPVGNYEDGVVIS